MGIKNMPQVYFVSGRFVPTNVFPLMLCLRTLCLCTGRSSVRRRLAQVLYILVLCTIYPSPQNYSGIRHVVQKGDEASCRLHRMSPNPYLINNNCCLKVCGHFLNTAPCSDPLSGSGYLGSARQIYGSILLQTA